MAAGGIIGATAALQGMNTDAREDLCQVFADSADGSDECAGDLGIAVPLRHQVENLPFPRRQPGRP